MSEEDGEEREEFCLQFSACKSLEMEDDMLTQNFHYLCFKSKHFKINVRIK